MVEILIIGQGVSGTLLSWFLHQQNIGFHVIDREDSHAASRIAAGLINPLTGRRLVKSWNIDQLYPFAQDTYQALSKFLGIAAIQELQVLKVFPNPEMGDFWAEKAQQPELKAYFEPNAVFQKTRAAQISTHLRLNHGSMLYQPAMQVDLPLLVKHWRARLMEMSKLTTTDFNHERLEEKSDGYHFGELKAKKVVFCEGAALPSNPWFKKVPIRANLGERLLLKIPLPKGFIYRHKGLTVPLQNGLTWAGSTNDWSIATGVLPPPPAASEKGLHQLEGQISSLSPLPYEVVDHSAAYRPTIKDRRPAVGNHPEKPDFYLLNGMGTKGASLAPFYADRLARQIKADLSGEISTFIPEAVDVKRFFKLF